MSGIGDYVRRRRWPLAGLVVALGGGGVFWLEQDRPLLRSLGLGIVLLGVGLARRQPDGSIASPTDSKTSAIASTTGGVLALMVAVAVGIAVFSGVGEPYLSIVTWGSFAVAMAVIFGVAVYLRKRK